MIKEYFVASALWFLLMALFLPEWIKHWKIALATSLSIIALATLYIKMGFDNFMFWVAITSIIAVAVALGCLTAAAIDLIKMELKNKKLRKQQPKELTVEEWFDVQRAKK